MKLRVAPSLPALATATVLTLSAAFALVAYAVFDFLLED